MRARSRPLLGGGGDRAGRQEDGHRPGRHDHYMTTRGGIGERPLESNAARSSSRGRDGVPSGRASTLGVPSCTGPPGARRGARRTQGRGGRRAQGANKSWGPAKAGTLPTPLAPVAGSQCSLSTCTARPHTSLRVRASPQLSLGRPPAWPSKPLRAWPP